MDPILCNHAFFFFCLCLAVSLLQLGRRELYLLSGPSSTSFPNPHLSTSLTEPLRAKQAQYDKFEQLYREFDSKDQASVSWLDKLSSRRISAMSKSLEPEFLSNHPNASHAAIQLAIEFPAFKHPIVYHQKTYGAPLPPIRSEAEFKDRLFVLHDPEVRLSITPFSCDG